MAANQTRSIMMKATLPQLKAMLNDYNFAVSLDIRSKGEYSFPPGMQFLFEHGVSMSSWGEEIKITVTPMSPEDVRVDVMSECKMPTQIIDWGKNGKNVEKIMSYIQMNIGRYAGAAAQPNPQQAYQNAYAQPNPYAQQPYAQPNPYAQQPNPYPQNNQYYPGSGAAAYAPQPYAQQAMKVCRFCGAQIPVNSGFCPNCNNPQN